MKKMAYDYSKVEYDSLAALANTNFVVVSAEKGLALIVPQGMKEAELHWADLNLVPEKVTFRDMAGMKLRFIDLESRMYQYKGFYMSRHHHDIRSYENADGTKSVSAGRCIVLCADSGGRFTMFGQLSDTSGYAYRKMKAYSQSGYRFYRGFVLYRYYTLASTSVGRNKNRCARVMVLDELGVGNDKHYEKVVSLRLGR